MVIARTSILFFVILVLASYASGTEAEDRLIRERNQNQSSVGSAEAELQKINRDLAALRRQAATNKTRIQAAQLELRKAIQEETLQHARVVKVREEIRRLSGEIHVKSRNITIGQSRLRKRARALWKTSRTANLEMLLASADATDFELNDRFLRIVSTSDVDHIRRTVTAKVQLEGIKSENDVALANLVSEERLLTAARNNVTRRRNELQTAQRAIDRSTASKEEARKKTVAMINSIKRQLASIQRKLDELNQTTPTPTNFQRQVSGDYFRPEGISLAGIYIVMKHGSLVKAMAAGEVLSIQSMKGMGQTVIVGHGGKLTSVYANLSSVSVSVGSKVRSGGGVGQSGTSPYGDMLYFAVYRNGASQDPMRFLN